MYPAAMVSIKRARQLLGKKAETMTDEDILRLENQLKVMVDIIIDQVVEMTPAERNSLVKKTHKLKNGRKSVGF